MEIAAELTPGRGFLRGGPGFPHAAAGEGAAVRGSGPGKEPRSAAAVLGAGPERERPGGAAVPGPGGLAAALPSRRSSRRLAERHGLSRG